MKGQQLRNGRSLRRLRSPLRPSPLASWRTAGLIASVFVTKVRLVATDATLYMSIQPWVWRLMHAGAFARSYLQFNLAG